MTSNATTSAEKYISNPVEAVKTAARRFIKSNLKSFIMLILIGLLFGAILLASIIGVALINFGSNNMAATGWLFMPIILFIIALVLVMNVAADYIFVKSQNMQTVTARQALKRGVNRAWTLLLAGIVSALFVGVGLIFLIIPGIYIALRLVYVGSIVANEDLGPIASIKRSWSLTKDNLWDIIGSGMTVAAAVAAISIILYIPAHLLGGSGNSGMLADIIDGIVSIVTVPLLAVIYFRYHQSDLEKANILKREGTDSLNYLILLPAIILLVAYGAYSEYLNPPETGTPLFEFQNDFIETNSI